MTGRTRIVCGVRGCRLTAAAECPLDGDTVLDLGVCGPHEQEIAAHPEEWIVTSVAAGDKIGDAQLLRKEDAPK